MTGRLRASVIPGLALTALSLTACASQGTIGASASGGKTPPGTSGSSGPSTSAPVPTTSGGAPSSVDTGAPTGGGTDTAPSTPAGGSSPSVEDSAALASSIKNLQDTWTDPGCKTALSGFSSYLFAQQVGLLQGVAALPGAIQQIRAGASQTKKPQAAVAMNRMVNDLTAMQNQAKQGQTPTQGPLKSDFQTMGTVCSQQP